MAQSRLRRGRGRKVLPFVNGDLLEWPQGMRRYSIGLLGTGVSPEDDVDLRAWFRVGHDETEEVLYLAVEVEDESVVNDTTATRD